MHGSSDASLRAAGISPVGGLKNKKGFTLIELLVVIAIIAILAVVVVLTLNPTELLRQARDSNRISDFATLKSAIGLYSEDVSTSTPMYGPGADDIFTAMTTSTAATTLEGSSSGAFGFTTNTTTINTYAAVSSSLSRVITGLGWVPLNFKAITAGTPISVLPVDPMDTGSYGYFYVGSTTSYKLATKLESAKYSTVGGTNDVVSTDGGNNSTTYETGTSLVL
jgi:prepilin-type N-terminal cleavage/methylation domain-containing protein